MGAESPGASRSRQALEPQPDWIDELDEHDDAEATRLAFEGELSDVIAARTGRGRVSRGSQVCRGARRQAKANDNTARRGR